MWVISVAVTNTVFVRTGEVTYQAVVHKLWGSRLLHECSLETCGICLELASFESRSLCVDTSFVDTYTCQVEVVVVCVSVGEGYLQVDREGWVEVRRTSGHRVTKTTV